MIGCWATWRPRAKSHLLPPQVKAIAKQWIRRALERPDYRPSGIAGASADGCLFRGENLEKG